jgi:hypothetical protein
VTSDVRAAIARSAERLKVGSGAGRRLGERPRVALGETLARRPKGENLLALHWPKTAC